MIVLYFHRLSMVSLSFFFIRPSKFQNLNFFWNIYELLLRTTLENTTTWKIQNEFVNKIHSN